MKCPFCNKEMIRGIMSGDGRSKVYWEADGEKVGVLEKICGKAMIDAEYTLTKFKIHTEYCVDCKKMIFDTGISK